MRFDLDKTFGIHQQALLVREKRAEILASNIANGDTPNYKARDIDFKQILNQYQTGAMSGKLSSTHPRHFSGGAQISGQGYELQYRQPMHASLDGNTVDAQTEKAEFAQNALQYQVSLEFLSGKIKNLQKALKGE